VRVATPSVAGALAMCAWFALGIHQAQDIARATAIVSKGSANPAQEREVRSLLRDARTLNPDRQVDVLLGEVEVEHRDYAQAREVLEALTRSEPENLLGWLWLARSAVNDRRLLYTSLLHVIELDPEVQEH